MASPAQASGSLRFVATNGSDSASGTMSHPWRTVAHGLASLRAGDHLYVRGGVYMERIKSIVLHAGTSTSPIRVSNYPGERATIKGLLWLKKASWWRFSGINVTWDYNRNSASEHMVKFTDGVGWSFTHAQVWAAHSYAAILVASMTDREPRAWQISRNCIHDTVASNGSNQDHLIYANAGLHGHGVIERNVLFGAPNGEAIKLGGPTSTSGGTGHVTVRYTTMYGTAQNMLVAWRSANNSIYRNLMVRTSGSYGSIRGYELSGANNVAHDNAGYLASKLILNDAGYTGVEQGSGNRFPLDPSFDSTSSCRGFHPTNAAARTYGRYA